MAPVLQRLSALQTLAPTEAATILAQRKARVHVAGELLLSGGCAPPSFLVCGWAAYQTTLADGRRQILRLLIPGDSFGEYPHLKPPAFDVVALTSGRVAEATPILQAATSGRAPGIARALALAARQQDLELASAITRLGAMSAYERLADLLVEIVGRLVTAGLSDGRKFPLPITQEALAETLGLSIVHLNRTLQQLRREKIIELKAGQAVLLKPEALAATARCEPRWPSPVRSGAASAMPNAPETSFAAGYLNASRST